MNSSVGKHARAALYMRLSKEDKEEKESSSISNQRSLLRQYAQKKNLQIYGEYIDDGFSGMHFDRPDFLRMLADIEQGNIDTVVTKDLSRLGRDYIQTGYYLEKYFPEHSVRYLSLLDGIDTGEEENGSGDITPFRAIVNDLYAKDISKKIKSVKRDKQKKGLFIGGKAPYGYILSETEKNKILVDDAAADVVRQIFTQAADGKNCSEIAHWLNEQGIETPLQYAGLRPAAGWDRYSGQWRAERVAFLLKNEVYIGNMVQGRVHKASYKSKKIIRKPEEYWTVVQGTHEAIVDQETFEHVQELLRKRSKTRVRKHEYPLKGLVFCQVCGTHASVTARTLKSGETLYFNCRAYQKKVGMEPCLQHMIREDHVTEAVIIKLRQLSSGCIDLEEYAKKYLIQYIENRNQGETKKRLETKILRIDSFLNGLYADKVKGLLDEEDFRRFYQQKKSERNELKQQIKETENKEWEFDIEELCKTLPEVFWQEANENKQFLFAVIERIELASDQTIRLCCRCKKPTFCS